MKISRRLNRFHSSLDKIGNHLKRVEACSAPKEEDILIVERCLIQLQIEWENFVRNFILDSATGRYRDNSGPIVSNLSSAPKSREQAGHLLVSLYPRRQFEPDWYLPAQAIDAAQRLRVSNAPNIALQLGVTPWDLDDLRLLRNFLSHRSKRSALSLKSCRNWLGTNRSISSLDFAFQSSRAGNANFEMWLMSMKYISGQLAA